MLAQQSLSPKSPSSSLKAGSFTWRKDGAMKTLVLDELVPLSVRAVYDIFWSDNIFKEKYHQANAHEDIGVDVWQPGANGKSLRTVRFKTPLNAPALIKSFMGSSAATQCYADEELYWEGEQLIIKSNMRFDGVPMKEKFITTANWLITPQQRAGEQWSNIHIEVTTAFTGSVWGISGAIEGFMMKEAEKSFSTWLQLAREAIEDMLRGKSEQPALVEAAIKRRAVSPTPSVGSSSRRALSDTSSEFDEFFDSFSESGDAMGGVDEDPDGDADEDGIELGEVYVGPQSPARAGGLDNVPPTPATVIRGRLAPLVIPGSAAAAAPPAASSKSAASSSSSSAVSSLSDLVSRSMSLQTLRDDLSEAKIQLSRAQLRMRALDQAFGDFNIEVAMRRCLSRLEEIYNANERQHQRARGAEAELSRRLEALERKELEYTLREQQQQLEQQQQAALEGGIAGRIGRILGITKSDGSKQSTSGFLLGLATGAVPFVLYMALAKDKSGSLIESITSLLSKSK